MLALFFAQILTVEHLKKNSCLLSFQFGELGGFAAIQAKLHSEDIELGVSQAHSLYLVCSILYLGVSMLKVNRLGRVECLSLIPGPTEKAKHGIHCSNSSWVCYLP